MNIDIACDWHFNVPIASFPSPPFRMFWYYFYHFQYKASSEWNQYFILFILIYNNHSSHSSCLILAKILLTIWNDLFRCNFICAGYSCNSTTYIIFLIIRNFFTFAFTTSFKNTIANFRLIKSIFFQPVHK